MKKDLNELFKEIYKASINDLMPKGKRSRAAIQKDWDARKERINIRKNIEMIKAL